MSQPQKIGAYQIEREIGRGGMGIVYLARDPRLDRAVAIKVLPVAVAADRERLARFEREARLLASLNDPNIGGIYGLEEADDGTRFLVLEYLDGPTLEDRLASGPMGIEEALEVFAQIAAGLEAAHESGVIHRDLKPANIKLTSEGGVKVLDFGLAKETTSDGEVDISHSPTLPAQTMVGVILGTAAYMSPEQARGKPLDRRTDIFSFGCVFYEALTGRRLFAAETVSDTIARILEREPDWSVFPGDTPDRMRRIVQRCLEKDPRKRRRDIGDVRLALEEIREARVSSMRRVSDSADPAAPKTGRRTSALAWGVAALAVAVAAASFLLPGRQSAEPPPLVRFQVQAPPGAQLFLRVDRVVISPDGGSLLWDGVDADGKGRTWVRRLDSLESRPLPGRAKGIPFWSPDSKSIGFFEGEGGKLRTMPIDGEESRAICDVVSPRGASWGADFIVFAGGQGPIFRVPVAGGTPEPVTALNESRGETAHRFPRFLPDGETFLFVALPGKHRVLDVYAGHVDGRPPTAVCRSLTSPVYTEPGYLIFQRGSRLVAQAFDPDALAVSGEPIPLGPAPRLADAVGTPTLSASRNGTLASITPDDRRTRLSWSDAMTGEELEPLDVEPADFDSPAVSPDGRHVALVVAASPEESDIWVLELERMLMSRFTHGPGNHGEPKWSPDGAWLAYNTDAEGPWNIYRKPFPGGGAPEPLAVGPSLFKNPLDWSPDGKFLMYEQLGDDTAMDLWLAPTDGSGEPRPYLAEPYQENHARFSPDGRWVAYTSWESGRANVHVNSFPVPGQKHRVSIDVGFAPYWTPDGKGIQYLVPGPTEVSARVIAGPPFRTDVPVELYPVPSDSRGGVWAPDGRFLTIRTVAEARDASVTVVLNWARQLDSDARE